MHVRLSAGIVGRQAMHSVVCIRSIGTARDRSMNKVWECDEHHDAELDQPAHRSVWHSSPILTSQTSGNLVMHVRSLNCVYESNGA